MDLEIVWVGVIEDDVKLGGLDVEVVSYLWVVLGWV